MKILLIISITCWLVSLIQATCVIQYNEIEKNNRPKLTRTFGSRTIDVPYDKHEIKFAEGDSITAFCSTGFRDGCIDSQSCKIDCDINGRLIVNGRYYYQYDPYRPNDNSISCKDIEWNVFESVTSFSWCNSENNLGSFIIATVNVSPETTVAEICFDYKKMIPKTLKYFSVPKYYTDLNNLTMLGNLFENEISDINTFYQSNFPPKSSPKRRIIFKSYWPSLENFEYSSLVQNGIMFDETKIGELWEIIWWNNLRTGNWKRYQNALEERSEHSDYKIYAGTFGVLTVPEELEPFKNLQEMRVLPENETIPLYIWNVLQEVNGTEEFVIFGLNSPYSDFLRKNDVELCNSICEDISWLKSIQNLFDSSLLGKMFCCTFEDASRFGIFEGLSLSPSTMDKLPLIDTTISYPANNDFILSDTQIIEY